MRLVEREIEHAGDGSEREGSPTPPRPEHRRVYVSLILTTAVLVTTVVTVYLVFPKRAGQLLDTALNAHANGCTPETFELIEPTVAELEAWSKGLVGANVAWPPMTGVDASLIGTCSLTVLHRKVAQLRLTVDSESVSLFATRGRDAPPRTIRRVRGDLFAVSYRRGRWTWIAVGPAVDRNHWLPLVGAPVKTR